MPKRDPKSSPKSSTDKLEAAYALKTPEDNISFYRDFATTYDEGFVADTGYVVPREVARVFLEHAGPRDRPVLDIGAGTGLLAESLAKIQAGIEIDGIDISAEMLEKAAAKEIRALDCPLYPPMAAEVAATRSRNCVRQDPAAIRRR